MGQYVIRIDPETRPISLDERAIILAAAISVDFDYFSRHSRHGGGFVITFLLSTFDT